MPSHMFLCCICNFPLWSMLVNCPANTVSTWSWSSCPSINYCPISYFADFNGEFISFDEALVQLGPGSGASAQCKICGKVFSNIGNGRLHLQDIHYPRSVECLVCEKICGSVKKFRNHIADTHKIREKNVIQKYGKMLG